MEDLERRRRLKMEIPLDRLGDLEVLLSDAFLTLGKQFESGKIRPRQSNYEWYIPRHDHRDLGAELEKAIDGDRVGETLHDLLPRHPDYDHLKTALATYREIANGGGWRLVPPGPKLKLGDKSKRVLQLRRRLVAERLLEERQPSSTPSSWNDPQAPDDWVMDAKLEAALKRFQANHGLPPSGALDRRYRFGPQCLRAETRAPAGAEPRALALASARLRQALHHREHRGLRARGGLQGESLAPDAGRRRQPVQGDAGLHRRDELGRRKSILVYSERTGGREDPA